MSTRNQDEAAATLDLLVPGATRLYSGCVRRTDAGGQLRHEETEIRFLNQHQATFHTRYPARVNDALRIEVLLYREDDSQIMAAVRARVLADIVEGTCLVALSPHSRIFRRLAPGKTPCPSDR